MEDQHAGQPTDEPRTSGVSARQVGLMLGSVAIIVLGAALVGNLSGAGPEAADAPPAILPTTDTSPAPDGTLGIRFEQIRVTWNEVTSPPEINRPLRRTPETGEFDTFLHRFDSAADISGAYRDSDDYLVALKLDVGLGHPDVATMHLHLCHLVAPFSPECLENFEAIGLGGQSFADIRESGLASTWDYEGNGWRVDESGGVLTIRVIAPSSG